MSIIVFKVSFSVHSPLLPLPSILIPLFPIEFPLSVIQVIIELPFIDWAIRVLNFSLSFLFVKRPLSFVFCTIVIILQLKEHYAIPMTNDLKRLFNLLVCYFLWIWNYFSFFVYCNYLSIINGTVFKCIVFILRVLLSIVDFFRGVVLLCWILWLFSCHLFN